MSAREYQYVSVRLNVSVCNCVCIFEEGGGMEAAGVHTANIRAGKIN